MILRKTKKLKNTLLALSSALALTACGGGGSGGGPVGVVNDFVNAWNKVMNLDRFDLI